VFANRSSKWCDHRVRARTVKLRGALLLLFLFGVIFLNRKSLFRPEPNYQNKRLTAWVDQWQSNHWKRSRNPEAKRSAVEAEHAILEMKDDAIPYLLDLMRERESAFTRSFERSFLGSGMHVCNWTTTPARSRRRVLLDWLRWERIAALLFRH
jgi:hypothetical protein